MEPEELAAKILFLLSNNNHDSRWTSWTKMFKSTVSIALMDEAY